MGKLVSLLLSMLVAGCVVDPITDREAELAAPPPNVRVCDGEWVNTNTNNEHCGGCDAPCLPSFQCIGGDCVCPAGDTFCPGIAFPYCANLQTSGNACGQCDHACPAAGQCTGGQCSCPEGTTYCANSYVCATLSEDEDNCGSCDNDCAKDGRCVNGQCQCGGPGIIDCNGQCCPTGPGGGGTCNGVTCSCAPGLTMCSSGFPVVCANLQTNKEHCGMCGNLCGSEQICDRGNCVNAVL